MKAKVLILAGAALLLTSLDASAQRRGRGVGVVTPFGSFGNVSPYYGGYGYNNYGYNGYNNGWNNGWNNNTWGYNNGYGYNRFGQSYVVPSQSSSYYYTPGTTYATPQVVQGAYSTTPSTTTTVTPASGTTTASGRMGLVITEIKDGPAKDAGLRRGDVILSVDGQRLQSFDELRTSLKGTDKKQVTVEFIDGSNGQTETKKVGVRDSKMGITVEEVPVNQ